jgi:hypothetical protein
MIRGDVKDFRQDVLAVVALVRSGNMDGADLCLMGLLDRYAPTEHPPGPRLTVLNGGASGVGVSAAADERT